MTERFRFASGGRVDRSRPLTFAFDGRRYIGAAGDTLASALLANGIHLVGRSFKYHRPRGIVTAGSDEPNALVTIDRGGGRTTPNLRATEVELYEGLAAHSQNRWPSLRFDARALTRLAAPLLPAGFYYKTFMWPRAAWKHLYEPNIRALAGLGQAPRLPDPDSYAQRYAHCDVLVVGTGPAGLAAATAAADSGARVLLCDEQHEFGGSLLAATDATIDGQVALEWIAQTIGALAANPRVTLLRRTTAFGVYPHNMIGLAERVTDHLPDPDAHLPRERLWQVRAAEVVIAAGAHERPMVFPGNDRPGVMLADAARTYVTRYGVKPGTRAVLLAAHDGAYRTALDLAAAGIEIAAIADIRAEPEGELAALARARRIPAFPGTTIAGTRGRLRVASATLEPVSGHGPRHTLACDLVLMSGGMTPSMHLFSQARGQLAWDEEQQAFLPREPSNGVRCAGACRGIHGLREALLDGQAQGAAAAAAAGFPGRSARGFDARAQEPTRTAIPAVTAPRSTKRAFVDFQNDVTVADLALATREGFRSVEHVKRYTTTGMATDQGKSSNVNALGIVAALQGVRVPEVGHTTFRPPYTPVTFGTLAGFSRGELFEPVRRTPIHDWAEQHGAVFENVGQWLRARYFPRNGETMHEAVGRECKVVRESAGLFDASTLGKIEVMGRDAATFLYADVRQRLG